MIALQVCGQRMRLGAWRPALPSLGRKAWCPLQAESPCTVLSPPQYTVGSVGCLPRLVCPQDIVLASNVWLEWEVTLVGQSNLAITAWPSMCVIHVPSVPGLQGAQAVSGQQEIPACLRFWRALLHATV